MGLLQKERVLTYPDTPKTILTQSSAYKLTAELPNMEYAPQHKASYTSFGVLNADTWGMRWSFIESAMILLT